jgi:hypothetical protein
MRPVRGVECRVPLGPVTCGECATVHEAVACPDCGEQPDGVMVATLQAEVTTEAGARWLVTAQRDPDTGGWAPVRREAAGSTPWADDATGEGR